MYVHWFILSDPLRPKMALLLTGQKAQIALRSTGQKGQIVQHCTGSKAQNGSSGRMTKLASLKAQMVLRSSGSVFHRSYETYSCTA